MKHGKPLEKHDATPQTVSSLHIQLLLNVLTAPFFYPLPTSWTVLVLDWCFYFCFIVLRMKLWMVLPFSSYVCIVCACGSCVSCVMYHVSVCVWLCQWVPHQCTHGSLYKNLFGFLSCPDACNCRVRWKPNETEVRYFFFFFCWAQSCLLAPNPIWNSPHPDRGMWVEYAIKVKDYLR